MCPLHVYIYCLVSAYHAIPESKSGNENTCAQYGIVWERVGKPDILYPYTYLDRGRSQTQRRDSESSRQRGVVMSNETGANAVDLSTLASPASNLSYSEMGQEGQKMMMKFSVAPSVFIADEIPVAPSVFIGLRIRCCC